MNFEAWLAIDWPAGLAVVALGLVGGVLSGVIGAGGAFFTTPGLMDLGVPGVLAVGSNVAHKLGKALVGTRRRTARGLVDRTLAAVMLVPALVGVHLAVSLHAWLSRNRAADDLCVAGLLFAILGTYSIVSLHSARRSLDELGPPPGAGARLLTYLADMRPAPVIRLRVSGARVSLWPVLAVGLVIGFTTGAIGVGGFLGLPAMIYLFGVPAAVAAGTQRYLAVFVAGFGVLEYGWLGLLDVRLTLLLLAGSLLGSTLGGHAVRVAREGLVRLVAALVVLACAASRVLVVPGYLEHLGVGSPPVDAATLAKVGAGVLAVAGGAGFLGVLALVVRARTRRSAGSSASPALEHPEQVVQGRQQDR